MLEEELGYRKEFACGGALRFAAIAFFNFLHVKIPGYVAKSLGIHHHPIMTHTSSGRCVRGGGGGGGGGGVYVHTYVFWLNYQVRLQSTDYFAPTPFLKIYVSNMSKNI